MFIVADLVSLIPDNYGVKVVHGETLDSLGFDTYRYRGYLKNSK